MVDVCERETEVVLFVEIPGVDKADVQLSWNGLILIISGQKRQQVPNRGIAHYLCVERAYGQFRREIEINIPIDRRGAKADMKNGLLRIHLPKITSQNEPDSIPIL
jgi:HSP20 family protein